MFWVHHTFVRLSCIMTDRRCPASYCTRSPFTRRSLPWLVLTAAVLLLVQSARAGGTAAPRATRSRPEVEALIRKAGETPPEWWDSVALDFPKTLDLSWPDKAPPGGWNPSKNVGQYLWSVINENPGRWKSGVRFVHYLLTVHKDDRAKLAKATGTLGGQYFSLLNDPARAAFWYRKSAAIRPLRLHGALRLAECYWRLGSKAMAIQEMGKMQRYIAPGMVKLWSDMGELGKALEIADALSRTRLALAGHMAGGDACRLHDRYPQALSYYQKALDFPATGRGKKHVLTVKTRARESIDAIKVYDALDLSRIPNGAYKSTTASFAGPLTLEVRIADAKIESVRVVQHQDKQYYGALTETPRQIIEKQGVRGVDAVTGATITSQAIINATAKALAGAMK